MELKFYDNDPKNGGKNIPIHKFVNLFDFKQPLNPTHNFNELRNFRLEQFETKKQEFLKERNFNEVETTDFDFQMLYEIWLKNELKIIKQWLSDIFPNGKKKTISRKDSESVEILKYELFINDELLNFTKQTLDFENTKNKSKVKEFNPLIFKDQNSYDLFLFLVEKYAVNKSVGQFSQIFHWLKETDNSIKKNTGVKYKNFVKLEFEIPDKFARIEYQKTKERPTFNELLKQFNQIK